MKKFVNVCRVLHVIASLVGVVVMCLMAVTGVMMMHPKTFNVDGIVTRSATATISAEVARGRDKGAIARAVQKALPSAGAVESIEKSQEEGKEGSFQVVLSCPQRRFDGTVDAAGNVSGSIDENSLAGTLSNLHKSPFPKAHRWKILMDVGAGSMVLACLTGIVLWLGSKARRIIGLVSFIAGLVAFVGGYFWLVP